MIWKHYDSRKIHRGKKCKPIYNAIAFPVYAVLFASRGLLTAGLGTQRAICQPGFGEQDVDVANTDAKASSASEGSSCPLVRGDEQRLRLFKTHLHGWENGCSTRQAVVPRTMTRNESPMPRLTSPHAPLFKAILEFDTYFLLWVYPCLEINKKTPSAKLASSSRDI